LKGTERLAAEASLNAVLAAPDRDARLVRAFFRRSRGFWSGPTRRIAWGLSMAFVISLAANMGLALAINLWNKFFFDALQVRNQDALVWSIVYLVLLSFGGALAAFALLQARMRLQLRWREWLTTSLVGMWLRQNGPERAETPEALDNPEARIADDGRLSIEILVDLAGGVINTLLALCSFSLVLWYVGGAIHVYGVSIPGYLVIVVVLYTAFTSFGMYGLGWPLVARVEDKAQAEGNLRYDLTRARQNAGSHAGLERHRAVFKRSFDTLALLWMELIGRQSKMASFSSSSTVLSAGLPLLLCAPKFLSGDMSLGDVMQASAAFVQVHAALNWPADNAMGLAHWAASARRVAALDLACRDEAGTSCETVTGK
jgi:putative ATP-binding cassette transporter